MKKSKHTYTYIYIYIYIYIFSGRSRLPRRPASTFPASHRANARCRGLREVGVSVAGATELGSRGYGLPTGLERGAGGGGQAGRQPAPLCIKVYGCEMQTFFLAQSCNLSSRAGRVAQSLKVSGPAPPFSPRDALHHGVGVGPPLIAVLVGGCFARHRGAGLGGGGVGGWVSLGPDVCIRTDTSTTG